MPSFTRHKLNGTGDGLEEAALLEALIRWAAGFAPLEKSLLKGALSESAVVTLRFHRLAHRLLEKVEKERVQPSPECAAALQRLQEAHDHEVQRGLARRRMLEELLEDWQGEPPVIVKGHTFYELTADPAHLRAGKDIDIFAGDPAALVDHFKALGFRQAPASGAHEVANLIRDDVKLDVHRRVNLFPVKYGSWRRALSLPDAPAGGRTAIDIDDVYVEPAEPIGYQELVQHAIPVQRGGRPLYYIPNGAMALLILVAHAFASYIRWSWERRFAKIRVGELVDALHLMQHPSFRMDEFLSLVEAHGAQASVEFAGQALSALTGRDPFASLEGAKESPSLPVMLWHGLWLPLPIEINQLILEPRGVERLLAAAGMSPTPVRYRSRYAVGSRAGGNAQRVPEGCVNPGRRGTDLGIEFSIEPARKGIHLSLEIEGPSEPETTDILGVDFGSFGFEYVYVRATGAVECRGSVGRLKAYETGGSFVISAILHSDDVPAHTGLPKPFLLGVTRYAATGKILSAKAIPLALQPLT